MLSAETLSSAINFTVKQFTFFNCCDAILEYMAGINETLAHVFTNERTDLMEIANEFLHHKSHSLIHNQSVCTPNGQLRLEYFITANFATFGILYKGAYHDSYRLELDNNLVPNQAVDEFTRMVTDVMAKAQGRNDS